jgi:hypothetical protein
MIAKLRRAARLLPLLLLAGWAGPAPAGGVLWNGIAAGSTPQQVGALLLVDERGKFHSFDRAYRIAQFYVHPDEAVRVAVLFGRRDGLVSEVDLIDGNQPGRATQALDLQFGQPLSNRVESRRPAPATPAADVRVTTWRAGGIRVVMEQPINRPTYSLRYCGPTADA